MRRLLLVAGVLVVIGALALWFFVLRGTPSSRDPAAVAPGGPVSGASADLPALPGAAGSAAAPRRVRQPGDPVSGFGAPGQLAKLPDRLELTTEGDGGTTFVNLAGGRSKLYSYRTLPVAPRHPLVVSVVDRARAPVAGAVVLVEKRFEVMGASLSGRAGGITDGQGHVTIQIPNEPLLALALHRDGWSAPVELAADASTVELVLAGRGALAGRATYNGHPETFTLVLEHDQMRWRYETDPDGTFQIASLPPGRWTVSCGLAQEITGGHSREDRKEVEIEAGKTATVEFAQTAGTDVVALVVLPAGAKAPETVEAFLFPGTAIPPDPKTAHARARDEHVPQLLFGGVDAMRPIQFHDVPPGTYLACEVGAESMRSPPQFFGCAQVTVLDGDTVREVKLALRAL